MEIEKYIINLLHQKDCVVIPGLGGFVSEYNSADIHPVSHKFSPPSKKLAFNEQLQNGDSLLTDIIASAEKVSKKEAYEKLEDYVLRVKNQLNTSNFYELREVGRFFVNPEGKLEFEAFPYQNFLDESFGLSDMIFKPIERNTMKPRPAKKSATASEGAPENGEKPAIVKKKSSGLVFALIPLLLLAGAGGFVFVNKDNKSMQAYFPFTLLKHEATVAQTETTEATTPETPAETVQEASVAQTNPESETSWATPETSSEQPAADYNQTALSGTQGAYSIIVGSFSQKKNAEKLIRKIAKKGGNAILIETEPDLFRVSVAEYNEKQVAFEELEKFRSVYGNETWVKAN
jgi:cell division septation protein DedD